MNYSVIRMKMTKALRETQTVRAGCSQAELNKICPAADPIPGGGGCGTAKI